MKKQEVLNKIQEFSKDIQSSCNEEFIDCFEDYQKNNNKHYLSTKGVYIILLKKGKSLDCIKKQFSAEDKDNLEACKEYDRLFYIGKTCNSFYARVTGCNGHMQGGRTSFSGKLFHYITGKKRTECNYEGKSEDRRKLTDFFKDNFEVKFLPIKIEDNNELTNFAITIIEEMLISKFKPPFNTKLNKNKN